MRRTMSTLLVACAMVAFAPGWAVAGHAPPDTYVRWRGTAVQKGNLGTHCWGGHGSAWCADQLGYDFPSATRVGAGTIRIRIRKPERPSELKIVRWSRVDRDGQPVGRGNRVERELRKVRRDGEVVAWNAVFDVAKRDHHYYLNAFGRWDAGDASYDFHVKTKR